MLDEQTIRTVKSTAATVAGHAEAITRRFYSLMFAENPEVRSFFNQAHQHSGGQQKALAGAICAYAANIDDLGALGSAVELIAQKHGSLGVKAEHYPIVGKHLLAAIQEVLGGAATDEVLGAWGRAYGFLADLFIARETEIYHAQAAAPGGWSGYRKFVVDRKNIESQVVTSFYLRPADGRPLASFKPGQYITIKIDHPITPTSPRNYSLSDRPDTGYYRISVKREAGLHAGAPAGLISTYLHDHLCSGDPIDVGPPCGEFTLDRTASATAPIVLASGGIGITPLLSMLKSLAHCRTARRVYFLHAALNSQVHAFADEVRSIAAQAPNIRTHFRYSTPLDDDLREKRCDSIGLIDGRLLDDLRLPPQADYYFCGPKPFMSTFYRELKSRGVDESQMHFEFFGPREDIELS